VRRRLWLSAAAVAVAAVLIAAVPLLVVAAGRDAGLLVLGLPLLAVALAVAVVLAGPLRSGRPGRWKSSLKRPAGWARVTRARSDAGTA